jgi:hypothetical protein
MYNDNEAIGLDERESTKRTKKKSKKKGPMTIIRF